MEILCKVYSWISLGHISGSKNQEESAQKFDLMKLKGNLTLTYLKDFWRIFDNLT